MINLQNSHDNFSREALELKEKLDNHLLDAPAREHLMKRLHDVEVSKAYVERNLALQNANLQNFRRENQQNLNILRGQFQNEFLNQSVQRERRDSQLERENLTLQHDVQDLTRQFNELKFKNENP